MSMLESREIGSLVQSLPGLRRLPADLQARVTAECRPVSAPAGSPLFHEGQPCSGLYVLTRGAVRVSKVSEDGRELLLYHVRPGELCVLTISCLLGGGACPAQGLTCGDFHGVMIPHPLFLTLMDRVPAFRSTVFRHLGKRSSELMRLVEEVAFQRLDRRLAMLLVRESEHQRCPTVPLTHQELAERLGTSREIVSRILGSFELQGLVELGRRQIQLLDSRALLEIASPTQG
jgi:CRP/FNR family transcriptional regulator